MHAAVLGGGGAAGALGRLLLAEGDNLHLAAGEAEADEIVGDGLGAAVGEAEVVLLGADVVGVAGEEERGAVGLAGEGVELRALVHLDGVAVEAEVDRGEDRLGGNGAVADVLGHRIEAGGATVGAGAVAAVEVGGVGGRTATSEGEEGGGKEEIQALHGWTHPQPPPARGQA